MNTENKKLSKAALCLIGFYVVLWLIRNFGESSWWVSSGSSITGYTYSNLELLERYLKMIVVAVVIAVIPYERIFGSLRETVTLFTSDKFNKNNVYSIFLIVGYVLTSLVVVRTYKRLFSWEFKSETIVFFLCLLFMIISVYLFEYMENKVFNILTQIAMLVFNLFFMLYIADESNFIIIMYLSLILFFICNIMVKYKKDGLKYGVGLICFSLALYFLSTIMNFNLNDFNESIGYVNAFINIKTEMGICGLLIFIFIMFCFIIYTLRLCTCIYKYSHLRSEMMIGLLILMVVLFIGNFYSDANEILCLALMVRLMFSFPNRKISTIDDDELFDEVEKVFRREFNDIDKRLYRIEKQLEIEESDDEKFDNSENTSDSDKTEEG